MEKAEKTVRKPERIVANVHEELSKVFVFFDEVKDHKHCKELKTYSHALEAMKTLKMMLGGRAEGPCPGTNPK